MTPRPREGTGRHLLTVAVEDYFQIGSFNRLIQRGEWENFESRVERNTRRALDLLDANQQQATFFVLGWVADQMPQLVAEIAARGHEIASKGYFHRSMRAMTQREFREDLRRAREALQRASGQRILGYRVANGWFCPEDLWALDVLADEGYDYDSSIGPIGTRFAAEPWRRFAHAHQAGERTLWEFPISADEMFGCMVPIAGGNWFRQLPPSYVRRAVAHWHRTYTAPFVMYFHVWELDPDLPLIGATSWVERVRAYRNLTEMPRRVGHFLERYRFTSIAEHLGLATQLSAVQRQALPPAPLQEARLARPVAVSTTMDRPPAEPIAVSVVIPCYNEELALPYLAKALSGAQQSLADRFALQFIFVDDCSSDRTAELLATLFGNRTDCRILRHPVNQGIAGALRSGLEAATTDIVASIDSDCTYDPMILGAMIPLLESDTDLVTASPYHPSGHVHNVPAWRLALSRTLSRLYRVVLHHKFFTYTSCCRVYRRSSALQIQIHDTRFLGVAELLARLDLAGGRIVEFPTTLKVRVLGASKMKVVRTILDHLGLLARLAGLRLRGSQPPIQRGLPGTTTQPQFRGSVSHV
ncbi:MAG: glycosyltransferase [Gemmatimonadales bacterium]